MDKKEELKFDKLIEHEHRLTVVECQTTRHEKAIYSDEQTDSALERKMAKLETQVKYLNKVMYMILSTFILGVAAWIMRSFI